MAGLSKLPECILDRRIVKVHNNAETQFLVNWVDMPPADSKWIVAHTFEQHFPKFNTGT